MQMHQTVKIFSLNVRDVMSIIYQKWLDFQAIDPFQISRAGKIVNLHTVNALLPKSLRNTIVQKKFQIYHASHFVHSYFLFLARTQCN